MTQTDNALLAVSAEAESTFQCGRRYEVLGDTPTAIAWQLRALELFRSIRNQEREAHVLNRLGNLSRTIGKVAAAKRYFYEAGSVRYA